MGAVAAACDTPAMDTSPSVSVPRLVTRRLGLREFRVEDFESFAAHLADADAASFIGVADRLMAWRIFGCSAGLWLLHGAGWWAVESRATGQLVGNVGAFFRERMSGIELGWNTYRPFWGQGFASETAGEALRYTLEVRGERQARALIAAGNAASIRVAQRLGLRYDADTALHGKPVRRYTIERAA